MDAECCDEAISKRLRKQRATFCVSAVGLDGSPWGATWQVYGSRPIFGSFFLQKNCKKNEGQVYGSVAVRYTVRKKFGIRFSLQMCCFM